MPYYESPYRTIKRAVEAEREAELAASFGSALRDLIGGAEKAVRECEHYGQQDYKRIHEYYLRELRTLRDCNESAIPRTQAARGESPRTNGHNGYKPCAGVAEQWSRRIDFV